MLAGLLSHHIITPTDIIAQGMPSVKLCGLLPARLACNLLAVGLRMARFLCALIGVSAADIGANSASIRTRF
jgi:hypothetical protein